MNRRSAPGREVPDDLCVPQGAMGAPWLTRAARRDWAELAAPSGPAAPFEPEMTHGLPGPARRWLNHAIRPGTPLCGSVRLRMHGRIRLGSWWPFRADQILRPPSGFIWAATARMAGLPVRGFDRYSGGNAEMRWRLLGAVPVMSATGPDVSLSAAGRLASEIVLVPAAALSPAVTWEDVDDEHVIARVGVAGEGHPVTLAVAPSGALTSVTLPRWGDPGKGPFGRHVFGVEVRREATFGGYTVPAGVRAGWWYGTERWADGEFIRFTVDRAVHF
ncbi:hypothetical protein AGRA3207_001755 [Actinomadura graeca]|uniref:Uncharacterized protein n=1 Tax=Actinomadura graeca TaxID=2750812 RepID=A0ABX8QQ78_9ACTN|nr:DUF6544 family protein [Actinomadura graeca]QXJ20953.1 hypothetical protein AGRA3207_001755 [Actinomadura graeca]